MKEAKRCRDLVQRYSLPANEAFMKVLQEEIPTVDLDGQTIYDSNLFRVQIKPGEKVDENLIAAHRFELRHKLFIYRRKRAMW